LIIQIELGKIKLVLEPIILVGRYSIHSILLVTIGTLAIEICIHQVFGTVVGDCIVFNINNIGYYSALNSICRSNIKILFSADYRKFNLNRKPGSQTLVLNALELSLDLLLLVDETF